MEVSRRDLFKLMSVGAAAVVVGGNSAIAAPAKKATSAMSKMLGKHQVLIIGGGWGGLTVAKELKKT